MRERKGRGALCAALVALYAAGLALMLARRAEAGLLLWAISTVGGMAALYALRRAQAGAGETEEKAGERDRCE